MKLTKADLKKVLSAPQNASVVTDPTNPQIVNNGGPADLQMIVKTLGVASNSTTVVRANLSNGVELISKPSDLNVPPWQMVSALLDGASLRTATWWAHPKVYSTTASTKINCWNEALGRPRAVEIVTTGKWDDIPFALTAGPSANGNHAKVGVSISGDHHYSIFGDMNQQGTVSEPNCSSSQNGRGGLFYVLDNAGLFDGLSKLVKGDTAPQERP